MTTVASESFSSVSAPISFAAIAAYDPFCPELASYLHASRRILALLAGHCEQALGSIRGCAFHPAKGGFYLFVTMEGIRYELGERGICCGQELCEALLLEGGVATLPGHDFGRPYEELSFRLAFVDFDGGSAISNYKTHLMPIENESGPLTYQDPRAREFVEQNCQNVVCALSLLQDFFECGKISVQKE